MREVRTEKDARLDIRGMARGAPPRVLVRVSTSLYENQALPSQRYDERPTVHRPTTGGYQKQCSYGCARQVARTGATWHLLSASDILHANSGSAIREVQRTQGAASSTIREQVRVQVQVQAGGRGAIVHSKLKKCSVALVQEAAFKRAVAIPKAQRFRRCSYSRGTAIPEGQQSQR